MERALALAAQAVFDTAPNPAVGCVIVADGTIVGEGATAPPGGPHAEIAALAAAGAAARGADVYVTLEPCCHHGRTGPCTAALIEAGVARVVYALDDPNPAVAGAGAAALTAAGITVESGPGSAAAQRINAGFFSRMQQGRPWLRVKLAASLDGRTALADGTSQWITGAASRADVHRWRARSGAILTGIDTVLADNPSLTARPDDPALRFAPPLRVVLDSKGRLRADARLFDSPDPVLVIGCEGSRAAASLPDSVQFASVAATPDGRCDLHAVMRLLASLEINDVWTEAGRTLCGALLEAGLVDELIVYTAPVVLGTDALGMFGIAGPRRIDERLQMQIDSCVRCGDDLRVTYVRSTVAAS